MEPRPWFYFGIAAFVSLILTILLFISVVRYLQYRLLFEPSQRDYGRPNLAYHELMIPVYLSDGIASPKIHAWYFDQFDPMGRTVLFCHGNSGNITMRDYVVEICRQFGLNLLLFDYRGFGRSKGIPDPHSILDDGLAAYRHLRNFVPPERIIVWGESLGGSVASFIAAHRACHCLILMCSFSSLDDIVRWKDYAPTFGLVLRTLVQWLIDRLPVKEWLQRVTCPVAIVHSRQDELIPYACAKTNYRNIHHGQKLLVPIQGGHASPIFQPDDFERLFGFCRLTYRSSKIDLATIAAKIQRAGQLNHR